MTTKNLVREVEKKAEILGYLHEQIFDPILDSPRSSDRLKQGVHLTIMRMGKRDCAGIVHYYWSAVVGTEKSTAFARLMRAEGFTRFEEIVEPFRDRFGNAWIRS